MGEKPISLDRRGTPAKRRMNRSPEVRQKRCLICGKKCAPGQSRLSTSSKSTPIAKIKERGPSLPSGMHPLDRTTS